MLSQCKNAGCRKLSWLLLGTGGIHASPSQSPKTWNDQPTMLAGQPGDSLASFTGLAEQAGVSTKGAGRYAGPPEVGCIANRELPPQFQQQSQQ